MILTMQMRNNVEGINVFEHAYLHEEASPDTGKCEAERGREKEREKHQLV